MSKYPPKCPECGHKYTSEQIWHGGSGCNFPTDTDGDIEEIICPLCGCKKLVTLCFNPEWDFEDIEDE